MADAVFRISEHVRCGDDVLWDGRRFGRIARWTQYGCAVLVYDDVIAARIPLSPGGSKFAWLPTDTVIVHRPQV